MPHRVAATNSEGPYLTEKRIEEEANLLLGELAECGEPEHRNSHAYELN
jgi:hypothetical protein